MLFLLSSSFSRYSGWDYFKNNGRAMRSIFFISIVLLTGCSASARFLDMESCASVKIVKDGASSPLNSYQPHGMNGPDRQFTLTS